MKHIEFTSSTDANCLVWARRCTCNFDSWKFTTLMAYSTHPLCIITDVCSHWKSQCAHWQRDIKAAARCAAQYDEDIGSCWGFQITWIENLQRRPRQPYIAMARVCCWLVDQVHALESWQPLTCYMSGVAHTTCTYTCNTHKLIKIHQHSQLQHICEPGMHKKPFTSGTCNLLEGWG